jgi:hypothetical protein
MGDGFGQTEKKNPAEAGFFPVKALLSAATTAEQRKSCEPGAQQRK